MAFRKIQISKPSEFGLDVNLIVTNIYIYVDRQAIEVTYSKVFSFEGTEVKRENLSFTLNDEPHISYWDNELGQKISDGILSMLS